MSINQINFGHQAKISIINPLNGAILPIPNLTEFDWKAITKKENSLPLNGKPIKAHTPDGWQGTITYDRIDNTVDAFFDAMEASYWSGSLTFSGSIMVYMQELSGTTSTWMLEGVAFTYQDAGKFTSQAKVTCKIEWEASDRVRIS